jgi:hypothetical protein
LKQIIYIFIVVFGLLSHNLSFGQKVGCINHELSCLQGQTCLICSYDNLLIELKDKDSLAKFETMIDSISKEWFTADSSTISLLLSDKWNLKYFQYSRSEIRTIIENFNRCFISTNNDTAFTSEQIFSEFKILDSISLKENLLKYLPFIYERDDKLNLKWTAILPDSKYLIIRMIHSYPNGNETSAHSEWIYYFRKVDK